MNVSAAVSRQVDRSLERLELDVNQADLTSLARMIRRMTTETISRLRKQGLLRGSRGKNQVAVAGLERLVHGERRTPHKAGAGSSLPT
ncbi:hypothetical protein Deipe_3896 (plasmid) [Deinococcus peraridilitoris DSM 19664]|uniref:Uncharacterized protein n=1 Tax=Deinococcus peraridilitoris (strain DSM 19664 / LMG 22246 / CIP 109416 / KR-200) TaxID=937777 RepID=L0A634_DEIPD|nr:hypothetical protein Deipe_3896 [Deinococcus peraridilitoris DSM 19664]